MITSHWVMDKPLPVKRVIPPRAICITVMPTPINNQAATSFEDRSVEFIYSCFRIGTKVQDNKPSLIFDKMNLETIGGIVDICCRVTIFLSNGIN